MKNIDFDFDPYFSKKIHQKEQDLDFIFQT